MVKKSTTRKKTASKKKVARKKVAKKAKKKVAKKAPVQRVAEPAPAPEAIAAPAAPAPAESAKPKTLLEKRMGETREQTIERWRAKHTVKQLQEVCAQKGVHSDSTMTLTKLCQLLYAKLEENADKAAAEARAKHVEGVLELEDEVGAADKMSVDERTLHPMKKPPTYKILHRHAKVYGGILKTRPFRKNSKDWISAVTGSGQYWEFCLSDEK